MATVGAGVSIVIPSLNTRGFLHEALRSWSTQTGVTDVEIIVVDMSSTDGTLEMIEHDFPGVAVIREAPNKGYGAAVNLGVSGASGEWIIAANSDVDLPGPGLLTALLDSGTAWPKRDAVFGVRLLNADGSYQRSARALPGRFALAAMFCAPLRYLPALNARSLGYIDDGALTEPTRVGWTTGALLLVRRVFFERIGGFDERFFMNSEEVDLCAGVNDVGGDVVYLPSVRVTHHGGGSVPSRADSIRWLAQGHALYTEKHFGHQALLLARFAAVLAYVVSLPVWLLRAIRHRELQLGQTDAIVYGKALGGALSG